MTQPVKKSEIKRQWHLIDAKNQILGRLASSLTPLLIGKSKPYFTKHLDCGDHVVVINAIEILVTGKKREDKQYHAYSGYPDGLVTKTFSQLMKKSPERIIQRAVVGMLPKNKLRSEWIKRLYVFPTAEHPFKEKFSLPKAISN